MVKKTHYEDLLTNILSVYKKKTGISASDFPDQSWHERGHISGVTKKSFRGVFPSG